MSIKRGPYGKPWITTDGAPLDWPDGAHAPVNAVLYERPSVLADRLDTKEGLKFYQQAQAVFGTVKDKSLAWQFRALVSEHADPWTAAKDEVQDLLRLAEKIGGSEQKSGVGTSIHRLCHLRDIGAEITYPVVQLEPWLDCYAEAMEPFEVLDDEVFVVCDELQTAGSFDRLLRDMKTGEVMLGDIKSGRRVNEFAMSPTVQVAIYGRSKRYDQETGIREPIHPDLNIHKGVLIHLPYGPGDPECTTYPLDLDEGYRLAKMSVDIVTARKLRVYKKDAITKVKHG